MYLYMTSKKKKQKNKQKNNAFPQNWIIKNNFKDNEVHKYYSNRDNIGDISNKRIFIDIQIKEQEKHNQNQLVLLTKQRNRETKLLNHFKKNMIEHSKLQLKNKSNHQIAGRHYIDTLAQKSFNVLKNNVQKNKPILEEKMTEPIIPEKIQVDKIVAEPKQKSSWSLKNIFNNFMGVDEY